MGITLITPTGDRHAAFMLCEKYMERQTYAGELQWIVVDDGYEQTHVTLDQDYIRRNPGEPKSLGNNLLAALQYVYFDKILVIEDDDWYSPNYVQYMDLLLNSYNMVGEGRSIYYNITNRKWRHLGNSRHASLCQTGFKSDCLDRFARILSTKEKFYDIHLWRLSGSKHLFFDKFLCVGMKGLPGRSGIGMGHRDFNGIYDQNWEKLRELIGQDVEVYKWMTQTTHSL